MKQTTIEALNTARLALIAESEKIGIAALVMKALPLPGQPPIAAEKLVLYALAQKYREIAADIGKILPAGE